MAYKIYVKSNYFYINDTVTNILYEGLSKDVRVRRKFADSDDFYFDNVNLKGRDWSDFQIPNERP